MTITDANSQIVAVNPAFSAISGYAMDDVIGQTQDEGRNTFRFFSSEINTASLSELLLENDLYGALDRGELLMYYQPKVDAKTGELVGAEALMRWQHREHGMVPPDRFIPLAEENGLINAFGEWAIRNVCAQQRAWLDAGLLVVPVAVNISAQQFGRSGSRPLRVGAGLDDPRPFPWRCRSRPENVS